MSADAAALLGAEIVLAAVAMGIYVGGVFVSGRAVWSWIALGGIVAAAAMLGSPPSPPMAVGLLRIDSLAFYTRWLALGAGLGLVLLAPRPSETLDAPEYLGSLLLALVGLMLVGTAGDLVLVLLGLELISIPTYVLLYLGRRDAASQEATAKYFFLSVLASTVFLYGLSFLYGASGATDLGAIGAVLAAPDYPAGFLPVAKIALVLVFSGLCFKIAAVPFHFYAPDVYQGTSNANAALLSVVPKIGGLVAMARLLGVGLPAVASSAWPIVMGVAVLTMTFGNVVALWQSNLRRLLAYSSIAHAGYLLVGLSAYMASGGSAGTWDGLSAMTFYLLVYAVATLGAFAALDCLGRGNRPVEDVEDLAGLAWTGGPVRPLLAWTTAALLFSLTGIPPLAGFWGKLGVFFSALEAGGPDSPVHPWFVLVAVIGLLNSAVAAAYYLRIVGVMFFRLPRATPSIRPGAPAKLLALVLACALVISIGLRPGMWISGAQRASREASLALPQPGR